MVGLQILPAWQHYFNDPNGKMLGIQTLLHVGHCVSLTEQRSSGLSAGLITAAQVIGSVVVKNHITHNLLT